MLEAKAQVEVVSVVTKLVQVRASGVANTNVAEPKAVVLVVMVADVKHTDDLNMVARNTVSDMVARNTAQVADQVDAVPRAQVAHHLAEALLMADHHSEVTTARQVDDLHLEVNNAVPKVAPNMVVPKVAITAVKVAPATIEKTAPAEAVEVAKVDC